MSAVFFDLDGTLLDTLPDIRLALNASLEAFGYEALSLDRTRAFIGNGARKLVERALPAGSEDVDAVSTEFRLRYAASDHAHTRPYDAIPELLHRLKARGVGRAVVTNKPAEAARRLTEKFFPGLFDAVAGDSGSYPVKPDASLSLHLARQMGEDPRRCVFVGDGETDVLTALNAGMVPVSVLWGYRTRAQLEAAGATQFAEDCSSLEEILGKFL